MEKTLQKLLVVVQNQSERLRKSSRNEPYKAESLSQAEARIRSALAKLKDPNSDRRSIRDDAAQIMILMGEGGCFEEPGTR